MTKIDLRRTAGRRPPGGVLASGSCHALAVVGTALAVLVAACANPFPAARSPSSSGAGSTAAATAAGVGHPGGRRALVLSGGGPTGRAFEIGILKGLHEAGIDLTRSDLIVGTSAGGVLGAQIRAGETLDAMYDGLLVAPTAVGSSSDPGFDPARPIFREPSE